MPKFSSREDYEKWKTERLQHLNGKNPGNDIIREHDEQSGSPNGIYPIEGSKIPGGMGCWIMILMVLVMIGVIVSLMARGQSTSPQTAVAHGPQPAAPKPSYLEAVAEARQAYEEHLAQVKDQIEEAASNRPPEETAVLFLDNQTGMEVLVKVVGDENRTRTVKVPSQRKVEVKCRTGGFYLKMRYRTAGGYVYQKGDPFTLSPLSTTTITLHKVAAGNYGSTAMNPAEF